MNYRPEYRHRWTTKSYYTQLRIDPLPPERAEELLRALIGEDPSLEPLQRALIERTGGNPFFLEESLRTLIETGVLTGEPGRLRLTAPAASIQVPETVQAVLAARIDRQQPEDKRLLQTAAVIGKDVPFALLQAIADVPEEALQGAVSRLQAAEFLYEASLFPDLEYTFKHALTHDVAYGSLLQERRKILHGRVVEAIERVYANRLAEHTEHLAYHATRGELWVRAANYLRQAGQKASARSANRDAVAWFDQALEALAHVPQTEATRAQEIDLLVDLRNALLPLAEHDRMLAVVQQAAKLAEALNDERRVSTICSLLAFASLSAGQLNSAVEAGQRGLAIARELDDVALEAPANTYLGYAYTAQGEFQKAKQHLLRNMSILVGTRVRELYGLAAPPGVLSRMQLMMTHAEVGEFEDAFAVEQDSVKLAETIDQPFSTLLIFAAMGCAHAQKGDFGEAIPRCEVAERLTREWGLALMRPRSVSMLGYTYASTGRRDDALPLLEEGMELARRRPLGFGPPVQANWLGEGLLELGRMTDAERVTMHILTLATEAGARRDEAWALRLLGEIHFRSDGTGLAKAEQYFRQCLALSQERGMRPLVAHCHLGLGRVYRRTAREREASAELAYACALYRETAMQFYLQQAEAELEDLR